MSIKKIKTSFPLRLSSPAWCVGMFLLLVTPALAQTTGSSPWENAVNVLQQAFTSTIARGLSLVAIVVRA
jgi:type IV secretory pathway VirB2 component (pilin)